MKKIAIITARGGSKRIHKKNIKDFCGKPIISYSIEAAIESEEFDEVMVSTDSDEIACIARKYGANVPFMRSERTSNDFATTSDVLNEVLINYEKLGKCFDIMCCIYPTAPFITGEKLSDAIKLLNESKADSLIPIVEYSFPPQRAFVLKNGKLEYQYPEYSLKRSQDLQKIYHDCGQFYLCKVSAFKEENKIITRNATGMIMPEEEVQDIDNISDWNLAEVKYKTFILKKGECYV